MRPEFFLAGMRAQRNKGGGRILSGDNTGGSAVMLRTSRFQCDGVWIPTGLPCVYIVGRRRKGKGLPQQTEVAQRVPGRLRPRIFSTFGTTRVVGRQPYAPTAFTPGEIPGTHF